MNKFNETTELFKFSTRKTTLSRLGINNQETKEPYTMRNNAFQAEKRSLKSAGFTLIELMIAVAIMGIIAAVGYPSYTDYVKKSRRADGHLALMNSVQSMERCKTSRFTYVGCTIAASQSSSPEDYYSITLAAGLTSSKFTIEATAQNAQESDTDCPKLTINELGERTPIDCW